MSSRPKFAKSSERNFQSRSTPGTPPDRGNSPPPLVSGIPAEEQTPPPSASKPASPGTNESRPSTWENNGESRSDFKSSIEALIKSKESERRLEGTTKVKWGTDELNQDEELEWGHKEKGSGKADGEVEDWGVGDEGEEFGRRFKHDDLVPEGSLHEEENSCGDDTQAFYDYVQESKKIIHNFLNSEMLQRIPPPPSPADLEVSYVTCPRCLRRLKENFAPQHIQSCSHKITSNNICTY